MFPQMKNELFNITPEPAQDATIRRSFDFDFDSKQYSVVDGRVIEIESIEAVKQWIKLFLKTALNKVPVYQGKKFGTSIKNVIGWKRLENGFVESELEREVKEGFLLNPAIQKVTAVDVQKKNAEITIYISVMLKDGSALEVTVPVVSRPEKPVYKPLFVPADLPNVVVALGLRQLAEGAVSAAYVKHSVSGDIFNVYYDATGRVSDNSLCFTLGGIEVGKLREVFAGAHGYLRTYRANVGVRDYAADNDFLKLIENGHVVTDGCGCPAIAVINASAAITHPAGIFGPAWNSSDYYDLFVSCETVNNTAVNKILYYEINLDNVQMVNFVSTQTGGNSRIFIRDWQSSTWDYSTGRKLFDGKLNVYHYRQNKDTTYLSINDEVVIDRAKSVLNYNCSQSRLFGSAINNAVIGNKYKNVVITKNASEELRERIYNWMRVN